MSKVVFTFLLIAGAGFWAWSASSEADKKTDGKPAAQLSAPSFQSEATADYIEIHDQGGRPLKCRVTAKREAFIQVEREADGKRFVIRTSSLDGPSGRMLGAWADFNASSMDADLYAMAQAAIKVELLNAPELNTFRCQYTGKSMKSSIGLELDAYRDFLRRIGVVYREVPVSLTKAADGGFYYPPEITDLPCLRIGDELIYRRDSKAIRASMIKRYVQSITSPGLDRR